MSHSTLLDTLSPKQQSVLRSLVAGQSVSAAAREAGVHRSTVHLWIRQVPEFAQAMLSLRHERANRVVDDLGDLADAAIDTFRHILADESASATVRLKAAMEIVKLVEAQRPAVFAPDDRFMEQLHSDLELHDVAARVSVPAPAPPRTPVRNAPCPCGSRVKYKRCCGAPAPAAKAA